MTHHEVDWSQGYLNYWDAKLEKMLAHSRAIEFFAFEAAILSSTL